MSLVWGLPLALAALAAVLVPVLLHLDRRRAVRVLPFAAMRWIADRHRPRRTLRLTEWLLLLLRVLLVACLAVWLAHPLLRGWSGSERWLAVVPGVPAQEIAAAAADADRVVWLAPGFPLRDGTPQPPAASATSSLLRELDARLAPDDALRVLVPAELGGLDAAAIVLSREIDWRVASAAVPDASASQPTVPSRHSLAVRYAAGSDPALPYLRAAAAAWKSSEDFAVDVDEAPLGQAWPASADALLQLGGTPDAAALALVENGATLLHIASDPATGGEEATTAARMSWPPSTQRRGRGALMQLASPLDPDSVPALQSSEFPRVLHRILFGEAAPPARAVASHAHPTRAAIALPPHETPLRPWLAWIAAGLFLLERVLANGRRLGRPA